MINSQSLSQSQKIKLWREHKEDNFKQIASDKSAMFNYFYKNNDIFRFIDKIDFQFYTLNTVTLMKKQANVYLGCLASVVVFDKLILNKLLPNFRFKQWRLTANIIKYVFWPFAIFNPAEAYFLNGYRENLKGIQDKYNFGFQDYLKANLIYEKALAVNRLEELLEKRGKFDWTNVPELPVQQ